MSTDLSSRYLGLELKSPLVVSACPLSGDLEMLRRLEAAGAGAAVLPSLFEEQIEHEERQIHNLYEFQAESYAESLSYFPSLDFYNTGPGTYLQHIEQAKQAISIPVIGSLNGASPGGWIRHARLIEDAGADAVELNIYFVPTDAEMSGADVEQRYVDLLTAVRETVSIPVAVKIGPNFSSLPHLARRLVEAGADGLVLFNRYLEPDIDLDVLEVQPSLVLSSRYELRSPLRWIAILRDQLDVSLAATSGVHDAADALKVLLAGADVAMLATTLLRHGVDHLHTMLGDIEHWLEEHNYRSVDQLRGSMSRRNCPDPAAFERANYMKALISFTDEFR